MPQQPIRSAGAKCRGMTASRVALLVIVMLAGALRLAAPERSPAGLQVDEASNAWNAWCLLKTGVDEHGDNFPIFYTRAFADYRSPLFLYFLMPFQAVGGLTITTTRLPGALAGVASVALIYFVGRRLAGPGVGVAAAALLAIAPWHLQLTRWGHEASITPFLVLGALSLWFWARLPIGDGVGSAEPKPARALVAGLASGIACYGYAATRLYLPVMLLALVACNLGQWRTAWKTRTGRSSIIALMLGIALTLGPLIYVHFTDANINARGNATWDWSAQDSLVSRAIHVAGRYLPHFDPRFLFISGATEPVQAPPKGFGEFPLWTLPFMVIGVVALALRAKRSASARVILAALLCYPAGDLLNTHPGVNAVRSFPGIAGLVLVAAIGVALSAQWIWQRPRNIAWTVSVVALLVMIAGETRFLVHFFSDYNNDPIVRRARNAELADACTWLKPRQQNFDAVVWSQTDFSFMYAQTLVYLKYDPEQWFDGPRERINSTGPRFAGADLCLKYGKQHFALMGDELTRELSAESGGKPMRILWILRPGEADDVVAGHEAPIGHIEDPSGQTVLEMYQSMWSATAQPSTAGAEVGQGKAR